MPPIERKYMPQPVRQQEAPEEQELRELQGNPQYPRSYLFMWVEPIRFKVLRRLYLHTLHSGMTGTYFGTIVVRRREYEHHRIRVPRYSSREEALISLHVLLLLLLANLLQIYVPVSFFEALVLGGLILLGGYILYRLYVPDRYVRIEPDCIRIRHLYEVYDDTYKWQASTSRNAAKPPRLQYHERWSFEALHYCRVETVWLPRWGNVLCMRLVYKNGLHTYIGLPSQKYARLTTYVLRKAGVEVQPPLHRGTPADMNVRETPVDDYRPSGKSQKRRKA